MESDITRYLDEHGGKTLLRFLTCGSVDDGKSTLIGRLLYDSKLIFDDQLAALREASGTHGTAGAGEIDYALLLDGLKAEREQGITIDVAYRYFATPKRKFIIADCPGHEQYTRNMATGASTADLAIILVDARHGVVTQTRRHAFIVSLLGIRHVVVAVNKMDLVGYSQEVFEKIKEDFRDFSIFRFFDSSNGLEDSDNSELQSKNRGIEESKNASVRFIPISARDGTNVVSRSPDLTPYYDGPSLLEHLETVDVAASRNFENFRFPVQWVIRPNLDFRGFAGTVESGVVRPGDEVTVLPSGKTSRVKRIVTADGDLGEAFPPQAVTLTLEDEIDVSSGDLIVHSGDLPEVASTFGAKLVWMDSAPLEPGKEYLFRHGASWRKAYVKEISSVLFSPGEAGGGTAERRAVSSLGLNAIAEVVVETTTPLAFDAYGKNRATGRFILVDPVTNQTSGAGMITGKVETAGRAVYHTSGAVVAITGPRAAEVAERLNGKLPVIRFETTAERPVEGQVEEIIDRLVERHVLPESSADGFVI